MPTEKEITERFMKGAGMVEDNPLAALFRADVGYLLSLLADANPSDIYVDKAGLMNAWGRFIEQFRSLNPPADEHASLRIVLEAYERKRKSDEAYCFAVEQKSILETRCAKLREIIVDALKEKGAWREAIVELEDHCSELVRLGNMTAAADRLDDWAKNAQKTIEKIDVA